jgi:hypothetical protein
VETVPGLRLTGGRVVVTHTGTDLAIRLESAGWSEHLDGRGLEGI